MFKLLRQRNFGLLWFGGLISMIGDWVLFIALPIYTYNLTHSSLATGIMFMVGTLPRMLFGSIAGVYVDRWDRQRTMVVADWSRVGLILLLGRADPPAVVGALGRLDLDCLSRGIYRVDRVSVLWSCRECLAAPARGRVAIGDCQFAEFTQ
jgi:hypothetical protein